MWQPVEGSCGYRASASWRQVISDEVPVVFHHKLTRENCLVAMAPAFAVDEVNLLGGAEREDWFINSNKCHREWPAACNTFFEQPYCSRS